MIPPIETSMLEQGAINPATAPSCEPVDPPPHLSCGRLSRLWRESEHLAFMLAECRSALQSWAKWPGCWDLLQINQPLLEVRPWDQGCYYFGELVELLLLLLQKIHKLDQIRTLWVDMWGWVRTTLPLIVKTLRRPPQETFPFPV